MRVSVKLATRIMKSTLCSACTGIHFRRREVLRLGALSFLGISLNRYLALQRVLGARRTGKAESCILIWLNGGPSHIDTWDPKPNSSFKPIATNVEGIQISELLPRTARHMDKLAVIRSMHTEENNHLQGLHYAITGHRPNPVMKYPSFGSIVGRELGNHNNVPSYVKFELGDARYEDIFKAHFIGAEYDPMVLPDPRGDFTVPDLALPESVSVARMEERRSFLKLVDGLYRNRVQSAEHAKVDTFQQQALDMILSAPVRRAFDLSQESEQIKDVYGRHRVGQSTLLAHRLVEAGCRFVTVTDGKREETGRDWDTHGTSDEQHRDVLVPVLDQVLSALLMDLEQRGLLESTVVMAMGEFGRTTDPMTRKGQGRDHWCNCWSMVLGGGGIRGGQVIGTSDERGSYVGERPVSIGDLYATVYKALGIDWTKEYMHPIGRPLKIANSLHDETGVPIEELV